MKFFIDIFFVYVYNINIFLEYVDKLCFLRHIFYLERG